MAWVLEAGDTAYKFSGAVWDHIVDLTVEFGRPVTHLRGLPRDTQVQLPEGVVEDLDAVLEEALEAGKPFPPGGDPEDLDGQLVLTRDTVHRVRHVLRSGSVVLLAYAPSVHIGEDVPEGERG